MRNRIKVVQNSLEKDRLNAFLVSSGLNIRYLTGFEGTAGLLAVLRDKAILLVDSRYGLKARKEAKGASVLIVKNYLEDLSILLNKKMPSTAPGRGLKAGFEGEHLSYHNFKKLKFMLPWIRLYPYTKFVENERACKDKNEIELIKRSIAITERALESISRFIRPGVSEKEIADKLEEYLRKEGARGSSLRTMAAASKNASLPHSEPGKSKIPSRGFVLIDVGCDYEGYNSDLTRLVLLGKMNPFEKKIVNIAAESQRRAIEAVRPGRAAKDIDDAARKFIEKRGFGKYFGHAHEEPVISKESNTLLKEGMVFTIEPGIYLPGRLGVRLEDIILVTKSGGVRLTTLPCVLHT